MNKYFPQYPIISHDDMIPRDQIRLVPESELPPLDKVELSRLREGKVGYNLLVADTPTNRKNLGIKTGYFQMVAYKEGWNFDPEKYRVEFVDPDHFLLSEEGTQRRVYQFRDDAKLPEEPSEGYIGFVVHPKTAVRMEDKEAGDLAKRVLKFFRI